MAKIVPLKKPNKPNYANPNTFCLISHFSIFSKIIKEVMAKKISYLIKKHSFLFLNY